MSSISYKKKENSQSELVATLNPIVKEWFFSKFKEFALPQLYSVLEIHSRNNVLVSAPTGSGKTLTAFLSILNDLINLAEAGNLQDRVYCVYISPLKALNNDIQINLREPLEEMKKIAMEKFGKDIDVRVAVRTGDTTPSEKTKMLKNPPHILITTPESLAIVLSSIKFREHLTQLWWVVIDEIHALAENKRGVHLSLSLERLNHLSEFTRVGLSATVAPLEDIARFLVGTGRECKIIDIQYMKETDIKVLSPVKNMIKTPYAVRENSMYELIHDLIQQHKTTLIFTNTRAGTERVVHNLKEKYPQHYTKNIETEETLSLIGAHHGSLSKKHRLKIEQQLRDGLLRCVCCSTSLELGIDIGYIDLVILLGSPKSVARALQRIGRSGHKLHETAKGRIIVTDRDDLVECSLILKSAVEKKIDQVHIPVNCLDVLAQQIFGMAIAQVWHLDELYEVIKKSYCYRDLDKKDFDNVVDYLAGKYAQLADRYVYAKIWKLGGRIGKKGRMSRVLYMTNIGTIPDQTAVLVKVGEEVIGTFDDSFLESLKPNDIFVLGGNVYQFRYSRGNVAQVAAAPGRMPTVPSWFSEMLPLSFDLSQSILKFRQYMDEKFKQKLSKDEIMKFIYNYLYVDENAANSIYEYFKEQYNYAKIPHFKRIVVENYNEEGKMHYIFHTLYGRRVNDVLSRALGYAILRQQKRDARISITDNGFTITCDAKIQPMRAFSLLKSDELRQVMEIALDRSQVLLRRFRHCAGRSLMILRNYKGQRKTVGKQQVSSMILMSAVKRISRNFPILKEARREVLEDLMDITHAEHILKQIEDGNIKIEEINTTLPSPFAFNLALQGYSDILKMEDKIEFIRRLHQNVLAKIALQKGQRGLKTKDKDIPEEEYITKYEDLSDFSYEKMWTRDEERKEKALKKKAEDEEYRKQLLVLQLKRAARKISLDPQIEYDCQRLILGEREGFKKDFKEWLEGLLSGAIPKIWSDDLVKFLQKAKDEI
ncbi:ATP-dependent helicase [Candidatus Woesearchaeota archaeon]|nr:ATP-dependent helicase [Candidatus Woesearchaeota archaeon]